MKKTMKRFLTAALVIAMMVTMITVPTYAAAEKQTVTIPSSVDEIVPKNNAAYVSGYNWGVEIEEDKSDGFAVEDGYLWGKLHNHVETHKSHTVGKKFTPAANGEKLKLSAKFRLANVDVSDSLWYSMGIQLVGDNGEILRLYDQKVNNYYSFVHILSGMATEDFTEKCLDENVTTTGWVKEGTNAPKEISGNNVMSNAGDKGVPSYNTQAKHEDWYARPYDGDLTLELEATPKAGDAQTYKVTQKITGTNISLTTVTEIPASKINALNCFQIRVANNSNVAADATNKVIAVKSLEIETIDPNALPKKTFTLLDDTMNGSIKQYVAWAGSDTSYNDYFNGLQWGYVWDFKQSMIDVSTGDLVFKSSTDVTASREIPVTKLIFKNAPAQHKSDLKFIYDVKTGSKITEAVKIQGKVTSNGAQQSMFNYDASSATLTFPVFEGGSYALTENTDYTIINELKYNKSTASYDLYMTVSDTAGNRSITSGGSSVATVTTSFANWYPDKFKDAAEFSNIQIRIEYPGALTQNNVDIFTVKNVKVENTVMGHIFNFAEPTLNNDVIMIDGTAGIDVSNAVPFSNEAYTSGNEWGSDDTTKIGTIFKSEPNAVKAYYAGGRAKLGKKFDSVNDGEVLKISGNMRLYQPGTDGMYQIILAGDSTDIALLSHNVTSYWNQFAVLHDQKLNPIDLWDRIPEQEGVTVTGTGTTGYNGESSAISSTKTVVGMGDKPNTGANASYLDGTVAIELIAAPNATDDNKYDIILTFKGTYIDAMAKRTVDKSQVFDIDSLQFFVRTGATNETEVINFSNFKIEKYPAVKKTALTTGTNTIYLPIENVTGHEANFALVAAVCDKDTEEQKDFFIKTYENVAESGNLEIDVDITSAADEYVDIFVFDTFEKIVPYTMPLSIGK